MSESVESIADAFRRRAYREVVVGVAGVLAVGILAFTLGGVPAASVVVLVATVVAYAPLFDGKREIELRTDDPPSAVRSAFAGRDCPLVALERAWGEDLEETDEGWAFSYVGAKIFRRDLRYESERTDDAIEVEVYRNDALRVSYEVSVDADDGGTRVSVVGRWGSRRHLRSVVLGLVRTGYERRVYEAMGYEVVGVRTRWTFLGSPE